MSIGFSSYHQSIILTNRWYVEESDWFTEAFALSLVHGIHRMYTLAAIFYPALLLPNMLLNKTLHFPFPALDNRDVCI